MNVSDNNQKIKEKFIGLRKKYGFKDPVYTDVNERAIKEWNEQHDYIPDIEEIDIIIEKKKKKDEQ